MKLLVLGFFIIGLSVATGVLISKLLWPAKKSSLEDKLQKLEQRLTDDRLKRRYREQR